MLQRKGRKHRHTLKALTDPQPEFVSLVFGGANKTPFRVMRADGTAVEEDVMTEARTKSRAIARVEFAANKFGDEAAVKTWLSSGGYDTDTPIQKTDDGFLVDSSLDPAEVLTCIDLSDTQGIKIFTVALKDDEQELVLTEKEMHPGATLLDLTTTLYDDVRTSVIKGDASVKDIVDAFMSRVTELIGKLPDSTADNYSAMVDAVAPEIEVEQVEESQKLGARNNSHDKKMIQQMHDHAVHLGASCDGDMDQSKKEDSMATENDTNKEEAIVEETAEKEVATPGPHPMPSKGKDKKPKDLPVSDRKPTGQADAKPDGEGESMGDVVNDDADRVEGEEEILADGAPEGDNGDKGKKKKKEDENSDEAEIETVKSDDPVAALTALVTELTASVKSMQETVSTELKEVAERVAAVEETRQTRKGADVDEANASGESKPTVSEGIADLRAKAMLGMRKR